MMGLRNILKQVLSRRRFGTLSVLQGLLLSVFWQIYKKSIRLPIIIQTYMGTKFILRPNCITSSRFIYEKRPDEILIRQLAAFSGDDTIFVDVGANVGLYSSLLSQSFSQIHAFEPNKIAAQYLSENLALNQRAIFEIHTEAVGATRGKVKFPVLDTPDPKAKIASGSEAEEGTVEVNLVTLDDVLPKGVKLVVKVDAEGHDADVIKGLKPRFENGDVKVCLFESNRSHVVDSIIREMVDLPYAVMDGNIQINSSADTSKHDLLLVRNDLVDVISPEL